uniref:Putative secreted protein n=1 Tax=Ixodes ricinus TaxID=34613 RepID=A0A6B0U3A5_IXORI
MSSSIPRAFLAAPSPSFLAIFMIFLRFLSALRVTKMSSMPSVNPTWVWRKWVNSLAKAVRTRLEMAPPYNS